LRHPSEWGGTRSSAVIFGFVSLATCYHSVAEAVIRRIFMCLRWCTNGVFAFPRTRGFRNKTLRNRHHWKHWDDFSSARISVARYEYMADRFLSAPQGLDHTRRRGDQVKYDGASNVLGIIEPGGIIETFFKPEFCTNVPRRIRLRKQCHNKPTHLDYVVDVCAQ
jgi:hypothetical protein